MGQVAFGPNARQDGSMAKPRRVGAEQSETRTTLLDVTERLMVEKGHAAVSSRQVAKAAGVTPALVHYYFSTLDDLFLAILHRRSESLLEHLQRLVEQCDRPMRATWNALRDPRNTGLLLEFVSAANHRKAIQHQLAQTAQRIRSTQVELLGPRIEAAGLGDAFTPAAVVTLMNAMAYEMVLERSIGMDYGHDEGSALMEILIDRIDKA